MWLSAILKTKKKTDFNIKVETVTKHLSSYATLEELNIKVRVVEVLGGRQREGRKEGVGWGCTYVAV